MTLFHQETPYFDAGLDRCLREMMAAGGSPRGFFLSQESWVEFWGKDHPAVVVFGALAATPGARIRARADELGDTITHPTQPSPPRKGAVRDLKAGENQ